jgi:hypothetical protein
MKNLKLFGLAAMAILALSVVGAGSASATVLCKTAANPCVSDYGVGTKITMQLPFGLDMKWTKEPGGDTCTYSSLAGEVSKTGGLGSKVAVQLTSLSWTSCGGTWETLKPGSFEVEYGGEGTQNPVTLKSTEVRVGGCTYSAGTGIAAGRLTRPESESAAAQMYIIATMPRVGGALSCSPWARWEAIYEVTAPKPLYVAAS